jgi:hypothetical protein
LLTRFNYEDLNCETLRTISYETIGTCSGGSKTECLLPSNSSYTTISFPDAIEFSYPDGTEDLTYVYSDVYFGDSTCQSEAVSVAFVLNSCFYFDSNFYITIAYSGNLDALKLPRIDVLII